VENTIGKMKNRNIDMMVLNDISRSDIGFESDYNEVTVITSDEEQIKFEKNTKRLIARKIWDIIKEKTKQINW
jgi:phosphopantothenoylcysteine decarboxylase/phosphopantothenate--cysteine ligase